MSLTRLRPSGSAEKSPLDEQIQRRKFPPAMRQLWLLMQRGLVKYLRAFWPLRIVDTLLLILSAFIIGESGFGIRGEFRETQSELGLQDKFTADPDRLHQDSFSPPLGALAPCPPTSSWP